MLVWVTLGYPGLWHFTKFKISSIPTELSLLPNQTNILIHKLNKNGNFLLTRSCSHVLQSDAVTDMILLFIAIVLQNILLTECFYTTLEIPNKGWLKQICKCQDRQSEPSQDKLISNFIVTWCVLNYMYNTSHKWASKDIINFKSVLISELFCDNSFLVKPEPNVWKISSASFQRNPKFRLWHKFGRIYAKAEILFSF